MAFSICTVDVGRYGTKVVTTGSRDWFRSVIGEYRQLKLHRNWSRNDMVVEYENQRYFVGDVALDESVSASTLMLDSKVTFDTKLLALTALHRVLPDKASVFLLTSVPIKNQDELEKLGLKRLLLGTHSITVNGQKKIFDVVRVEVGAECAVVAWQLRHRYQGRRHFVDPGSRTVNFTTLETGRWIDQHSGTLDYGLETNDVSLSMFARMVIGDISKRVKSLAPITLIGGKADILVDYFRQYTTNVEALPNALYANAEAIQRFWEEQLSTTDAFATSGAGR